jgi:hypothetical protein
MRSCASDVVLGPAVTYTPALLLISTRATWPPRSAALATFCSAGRSPAYRLRSDMAATWRATAWPSASKAASSVCSRLCVNQPVSASATAAHGTTPRRNRSRCRLPRSTSVWAPAAATGAGRREAGGRSSRYRKPFGQFTFLRQAQAESACHGGVDAHGGGRGRFHQRRGVAGIACVARRTCCAGHLDRAGAPVRQLRRRGHRGRQPARAHQPLAGAEHRQARRWHPRAAPTAWPPGCRRSGRAAP